MSAELKKIQEQALVLKKHLEETQKLRERAEKSKEQAEKAKIDAEQAMNEAEQRGTEVGIAETEKAFRAEVPEVCHIYCARTWSEALNRVGVEASSELRKLENVFYPEAIRPLALLPIRLTLLLQLLTSMRRVHLAILLPLASQNQLKRDLPFQELP